MTATANPVQEIEQAIQKLTTDQLDELYLWLSEYQPQPIDERIAADLRVGLLDRAIARALDDAANGRTQPL